MRRREEVCSTGRAEGATAEQQALRREHETRRQGRAPSGSSADLCELNQGSRALVLYREVEHEFGSGWC